MGRAILAAVGVAPFTVAAAPAAAWSYRLELSPPVFEVWGGLPEVPFTFDLFLDALEPGIESFSASLVFDPSVIRYEPALSYAEDYYPLYAPAVAGGKGTPGFPATWLAPDADPPSLAPSAPPGMQQIDLAFHEHEFNPAQGVATRVHLATLAFSAVDYGYDQIDLTFDQPGDVFIVNGVDVSGSVSTGGAFVEFAMPEPGTGLLVGCGLGCIALGRRRLRLGRLASFRDGG